MEREGAGVWLGSGPTPAPSWHAVGAVAPGTGPLSGQDRQLLRGVGESGSGRVLSVWDTHIIFISIRCTQSSPNCILCFCVVKVVRDGGEELAWCLSRAGGLPPPRPPLLLVAAVGEDSSCSAQGK